MGILSDFVSKIDEAASEHRDNGISNVAAGLMKIFGINDNFGNTKFDDPVDVLNYLLKEVTNGNCEHQLLKLTDDYATILNWVQKHAKGDRFYMIRGKFKSGDCAIGVFFATEEEVFAEKTDPKICYVCKVIPSDINDLFGKKSIFVQKFN